MDNTDRSDKFVESFDVSEWQVDTDSGWVDVVRSHKTVEFGVWIVETESGKRLRAADRHMVFDGDLSPRTVDSLREGDVVLTVDGPEKVSYVGETGEIEEMYDLELPVDSGHRYYTDGILSHNTTSCTIFALWTTMFYRDKKVLFAANKFATILEILSRIRLAYELVPNWLKPGLKKWTDGKIVFANDSQIEGVTTTSDSGRSRSANILMIDEAAYIDNDKDFFASVVPIISSAKGTKIVMTSTPNGRSNIFYETYESARLGVSQEGWTPFRMDWYDFPGRDEAWRKQMFATLNGDLVRWNREFGNSFEGSSYTLLRPEDIAKHKERVTSPDYREPRLVDVGGWKYRQWEAPRAGATYLIGADVGDGVGRDYSVVLVFDVTNCNKIHQVASFSENMIGPVEFTRILARLAVVYNSAFVAAESNSIGSDVLRTLMSNYGHENIVNYNGGESKRVLGIMSSNPVKASACRWLREFSAIMDITVVDKTLVAEMEYFERKDTNLEIYCAKAGMNDDHMMAFVWAMYCLNEKIVENVFIVERYMRTGGGLDIPLVLRNPNVGFVSDDSSMSIDSAMEKRVRRIDDVFKNLTGSGGRGLDDMASEHDEEYRRYKGDMAEALSACRLMDDDGVINNDSNWQWR